MQKLINLNLILIKILDYLKYKYFYYINLKKISNKVIISNQKKFITRRFKDNSYNSYSDLFKVVRQYLKQDGKRIIGYREAMTLPKQPKSMVVVGSGAIGVEFAYFYNTIGTKVTIVEFLPNVVPVEDEEVSKQLERSFKKAGIDIMTN